MGPVLRKMSLSSSCCPLLALGHIWQLCHFVEKFRCMKMIPAHHLPSLSDLSHTASWCLFLPCVVSYRCAYKLVNTVESELEAVQCVYLCFTTRSVFRPITLWYAGFAVSLRALNFFGLYTWEDASRSPMDWGSAKMSSRSLLLLFIYGCRCLILWLLPGLRWGIRTTCLDLEIT